MEAEPKRVDIINFLAPVNDHTISHLIDVTYTAHSEGTAEVHLYISSVGGRLNPAFTAYNFFRSLHMPFFTHNLGSVESAAMPLYLASDHRTAAPGSKFFLYSFEWTFYRDHIRFHEIAEAYESLTFDMNRFTEIFNERTNQTFDLKKCLTGAGEILDVRNAIQAGIVTTPQITPAGIPELAKLWLIHS